MDYIFSIFKSHKTQQSTREQAVKYFSKIKQMPVEKFNEIFIVTEIKK